MKSASVHDEYNVLCAAVALRRFTPSDLASYTGLPEATAVATLRSLMPDALLIEGESILIPSNALIQLRQLIAARMPEDATAPKAPRFNEEMEILVIFEQVAHYWNSVDATSSASTSKALRSWRRLVANLRAKAKESSQVDSHTHSIVLSVETLLALSYIDAASIVATAPTRELVRHLALAIVERTRLQISNTGSGSLNTLFECVRILAKQVTDVAESHRIPSEVEVSSHRSSFHPGPVVRRQNIAAIERTILYSHGANTRDRHRDTVGIRQLASLESDSSHREAATLLSLNEQFRLSDSHLLQLASDVDRSKGEP